jgi:anti-sigma factor RsiW
MTHSTQPPHEHVDEGEWALQEQALRAERLGLDPSGDAGVQRYRAVMHALREPLDADLPTDFAAQMARQVRERPAIDMRLELWLSGALLGVLGAMMLGVVVTYGQAWLQLGLLAITAHGLSNPWLLALVICVALPGLLGSLMPGSSDSVRES